MGLAQLAESGCGFRQVRLAVITPFNSFRESEPSDFNSILFIFPNDGFN